MKKTFQNNSNQFLTLSTFLDLSGKVCPQNVQNPII